MPGLLYMGAFDSESCLRDKSLSKLPASADKERGNIVLSMDSLLFPFCRKGDALITRYKIDPCHKEYLEQIGFAFVNAWVDNGEMPGDESVFSLVPRACESGCIDRRLFTEDIQIVPYSIVPSFVDMCRSLGIQYTGPHIDTVKKVNSKIYSANLEKLLNPKNRSVAVYSHSEMLEAGIRLLADSAFLIKDPYGVSGKGNLLINSEAVLRRIVKHIALQESAGCKTEFIMEPLLDKKLDFSCEFTISPEGRHTFICIQNTANSGFAYSGSYTADKDFLEYLKGRGYFDMMERVAEALYKEGYHGDVCVDSMLLKDDEIVGIVEINARKSMGFINYEIDRYLSNFGLRSNFTFFSVGFTGEVSWDEILSAMEKKNLLFKAGCSKGVIPLSETALFINRKLNKDCVHGKVNKGRFYISAAGKSIDERNALLCETKELLQSMAFRIY